MICTVLWIQLFLRKFLPSKKNDFGQKQNFSFNRSVKCMVSHILQAKEKRWSHHDFNGRIQKPDPSDRQEKKINLALLNKFIYWLAACYGNSKNECVEVRSSWCSCLCAAFRWGSFLTRNFLRSPYEMTSPNDYWYFGHPRKNLFLVRHTLILQFCRSAYQN